ncbi:MAG: substrate-binding domain-containing protein [Candidatus Velthaea sp.]
MEQRNGQLVADAFEVPAAELSVASSEPQHAPQERPRAATCGNVDACSIARSGEEVEWYAGAGEYCPECGEALKPGDLPFVPTLKFDSFAQLETPPSNAPANSVAAGVPDAPAVPGAPAQIGHRRAPLPVGVPPHLDPSRRWLWAAAGAIAVGAVIISVELYAAGRPGALQQRASGSIEVCAIPSARQLAADLVRGFAAKTGVGTERFMLRNGSACDVRFSSAGTPDDVIARDGIVAVVNPLNPVARISESQLHGIYNGSIRDWSQLGGPRGKIIALMPADASDEATAIASSVFFGATIDSSVRRAGSSADVTRAVTGADARSRASIGLVPFSQSIPAKVVPLAYLPPPSVVSIGTRRYPYTLTIAVQASSATPGSTAQRFVDYAKSVDGEQLVAKDGLVSRGDL